MKKLSPRCICSLRLLLTKCHKLVGLSQQKCILLQAGGWTSEFEERGGPRPLCGCRQDPSSPRPSSPCWLSVFGVFWPAAASLHPLLLSSHVVLPATCPGVSVPSYKNTSHTGLRTHPIPKRPDFNLTDYISVTL